MNMTVKITAIVGACAALTQAGTTTVSTYDDLTEGFYGNSFYYNGVTYNQVNNVDGVMPDGERFRGGSDGPDTLGDDVVVENAAVFYDEFPSWGSANNVLTFGRAYVVGDNLSLGAISTVTMGLDEVATFASLEMAYFENGPWGGIEYHLDAFNRGELVASDSFTIADGGGRDNIALATMSVGGAEFDTLQLYATLGSEFTAPRIIVDNLTITSVPAPSALALLGMGALGASRRRR